jgi:hypothetical protein
MLTGGFWCPSISRAAQARPRNLTGSDGRLRKDKRQTCKKLGSGGLGTLMETLTASTTSSEFIIYSSKQGSRATILRQCDIVVIQNRKNLQLLLSRGKHLMKSSCAAFCPCPLLQLGAVPIPACRLLDIAELAPFCSWGLCQTQNADMAVLMSSSHRLLILHSQHFKPHLTTWATPPAYFVLVIFGDRVLRTMSGLTSNCDPPELSLPSSWDYRRESLITA